MEIDNMKLRKGQIVSVTDWPNGEGYDVDMNEKGCHSFFQMTLDQWRILKKVMKAHGAKRS